MYIVIAFVLLFLVTYDVGTIIAFEFASGYHPSESKSAGASVMSNMLIPSISSSTIFSPIDGNTSSPELNGTEGQSNLTTPRSEPGADCIDFNSTEIVITISCDATFADIPGAVNNSNAIKKVQNEDGTWLLNSSLNVRKSATLVMNGDADFKSLRISSSSGGNETNYASNITEDNGQHGIRVFGALNMSGIKITSWDPTSNKHVVQNANGTIPRPYIVIEPHADPSFITSSEIAYLGYDSPRKQGLNMYGGEGTVISGNRIHDLWFGFSSVNVGHIIIENNSIYDNIQYGVDPHSGSHDLVVRENHISNNTNGLVCSRDCYDIVFEGNQLDNNKEVSIMFSRNTSNSVARNNNISNSYIGISSSESYANNFTGNTVNANRHGLQLKDGSAHNLIDSNKITNSLECGIALAQVENNTSIRNSIFSSKDKGICLSQAAYNNIFYSNLIDSPERFGISIKDQDTIKNIFENNTIRLAENGIALTNNSDTVFINNILYEIKGLQYRISDNSSLNLQQGSAVEHRIRSIGTVDNSLKLEDSGKVSLIITDDEEDISDPFVTKTPMHDSDASPLIKNLSPQTITEISSAP